MSLKEKKILITGGSGFIGLNLMRRLEKLKAKTINYDISRGDDISDAKRLEQVIRQKFDIIFHLAGFSGSSESNNNIEKSFKINTLATVNLFDLVLKHSPKTKIILSNSRLEYGKPQYLPVEEKHPTLPTSTYGLSKLLASQMALAYHKSNSLKVTIFRTSNVYGPHPKQHTQDYNIINHFIDLAKKNGCIDIYGDGNQLRDYLYIDDMVDAFILGTKLKKNGQIFNLGYGKGIKFKEMVKLIIKIVGKGQVKFVKWPSSFEKVETGSYVTNISKFTKETGFSPKINFIEGIKRTI